MTNLANRLSFNWTRLTFVIAGILTFSFALCAQPYPPATDSTGFNPWLIYIAIALAAVALIVSILAFLRRRSASEEEPERPSRREPKPEPRPIPKVTILPNWAPATAGTVKKFYASVASGFEDAGLEWELSPKVGTISENGTYTAPDTVTEGQEISLTVTIKGTRASDKATISLEPKVTPAEPLKPASVSPAPSPAPADRVSVRITNKTFNGKPIDLKPNETYQFKADVIGSDEKEVVWSIRQPNMGRPAAPWVGTIDSKTGYYTAAPDFRPGSYAIIVATAKADPKAEDTAKVNLIAEAAVPANAVKVSPETVGLKAGELKKFSAVFPDITDPKFVWSIAPAIGNIDLDGTYKAPDKVEKAETITVKAVVVTNPYAFGTATVNLVPATPSASSLPPDPNKVCFENFHPDQQEKLAVEVLKQVGTVAPSQTDVNDIIRGMIAAEREGRNIREKLAEMCGGSDSEAVRMYDAYALLVGREKPSKADTDTTRNIGGKTIIAIAMLALLSVGRVSAATWCGESRTGASFIAAGSTRTFVCNDVPANTNDIKFTDDRGKAVSGIKVGKVSSNGYNVNFEMSVDTDVSPMWPKMLANGRDEGHPIRILTPGQAGSAQAAYDASVYNTQSYVQQAVPGMVTAAVAANKTVAAQASAPAPATAKSTRTPDEAYNLARLALRLAGREPLRDSLGAEAGDRMYRDFIAGRVSPEEVFRVIENNRTEKIVSVATTRISGRLDEAIKSLEAAKADLASRVSTVAGPSVSDSHIRDIANDVVSPVRDIANRALTTANTARGEIGSVRDLAQGADTSATLTLEAYQAEHDKSSAKKDGNMLRDKKTRNRTVAAALAQKRAAHGPLGVAAPAPAPPAKK